MKHTPDAAEAATLSLTIPAKDCEVRNALVAARQRLSVWGVDQDTLAAAEIVLAEVLNNIVEHAYAKIPPGEILLEEFMKPLGVSRNRLARDIDVPVTRVGEIVAGTRTITADTALRLGSVFGMPAEFWLNLQNAYDLRVARRTTWPALAPRMRPYVGTA